MMQALLATLATMKARLTPAAQGMRKFANHEEGFLNLGAFLTLAGIVLAAVVGVILLSALAPTFFSALADLVGTFKTADVNDTTANTIANGIFPLLLALGGIFAIGGLAFAAYRMR